MQKVIGTQRFQDEFLRYRLLDNQLFLIADRSRLLFSQMKDIHST